MLHSFREFLCCLLLLARFTSPSRSFFPLCGALLSFFIYFFGQGNFRMVSMIADSFINFLKVRLDQGMKTLTNKFKNKIVKFSKILLHIMKFTLLIILSFHPLTPSFLYENLSSPLKLVWALPSLHFQLSEHFPVKIADELYQFI